MLVVEPNAKLAVMLRTSINRKSKVPQREA